MAKNKAKMNKFLTGAITATMVASAVAPVAASAADFQFTDVKEGTSHYDNIMRAAERGLMTGYLDGSFKPLQDMSRGQVVKALAKYISSKDGMTPDAYVKNHHLVDKVEAFNDVPADYRDKELYIASLIVKDNGAFTGDQNNLKPTNKILRQHMAKVVVEAFGLEKKAGVDADVTDMIDVPEQYREYVEILAQNEVTKSDDGKFKPANNLTRQQMASFLNRAFDIIHGEDSDGIVTSGIKSVESINDTTIEVEFAKAIDKDFIREAERNGEYFRVFLQGDSASSDKAIKSETITFSNDGKTARFTLGETVDGEENDNFIESGKKYTVALTDGDNKTATVQYEYGPTELKASAARPDFTVDSVADKIFVKFGEKMKSSALEQNNYEVYDEGGKKLGDLSDFIKGEGTWVDATRKTEVEFTLDKDASQKLLAGKKYKLYVDKDVQTDKNKTLSERDRTITVSTPSVNEAKPKAVMARVTDDYEVVVVFDKDVDGDITVNKNQVEVKTTTGKTIEVSDIVVGDNSNEVKITTNDKLNRDTSYNVDLPANAVTNAVFPNASSDAVSKLRAAAQDDIEIKSVKAELKASPKNKKRADLHLTFDQRPNLESIDWNKVVIEDGSDVYTVNTSAAQDNVKYVGDKTIAIENVSDVFADGSTDFRPEKGTTYTFEIGANGVETDSFGNSEGKKNQAKLKTTFGGVSVNDPRVDKITLVSEKEIKIDFKETISNVSADDVYVAGFELYSNGNFADITLNGTDHLSTSVSGSTLTLKTKGDTVFRTGFDDTNIEIKANSFTSKDNKVENELIEIDGSNYDDYKNVDDAGPILIGAETTGYDNEVELTFSESLEEHGDSDKIATLFSVKNAANNAVGKSINVSNDKAVVTFNDTIIDEDTVLSRVEVSYNSGGSFYLNDEKGNKAAKTTVKGIKGDKPSSGGNNGGGGDTGPNTDALESTITDAEALNEADYTAESWEALQDALADAKAIDNNSTQALK